MKEGRMSTSVRARTGPDLKYVGKESTHTPGTLCTIPSGVLNCLAKLTSRKPSTHSETVDKIYPDYANAFRKAGLTPPISPTMGDLWRKQDEKVDMEKERDVSKKKTEMSTFVLRTYVTFLRLSTG